MIEQKEYVIIEEDWDTAFDMAPSSDTMGEISVRVLSRPLSEEIENARKETLTELRKHLIKISESGVCATGWEPTDPNRACENDTCAICIFDMAVKSLIGDQS